jgi:hypothetical protein
MIPVASRDHCVQATGPCNTVIGVPCSRINRRISDHWAASLYMLLPSYRVARRCRQIRSSNDAGRRPDYLEGSTESALNQLHQCAAPRLPGLLRTAVAVGRNVGWLRMSLDMDRPGPRRRRSGHVPDPDFVFRAGSKLPIGVKQRVAHILPDSAESGGASDFERSRRRGCGHSPKPQHRGVRLGGSSAGSWPQAASATR